MTVIFIRKFLFHRVTFVLLALLVQLTIFISIIIRFNEYFISFYLVSILVSVTVVVFIINNNSNPAYKIAWIILILILPIFGGIFYLFFGGNKLSKRNRKKMEFIERKTRDTLAATPSDLINNLSREDKDAGNQSRYLNNYSYYPPHCNTTAYYLSTGEEKFKRLTEELLNAKEYIFLEYFIIEAGIMWDTILEILVQKVKEGLDVRVIYDDVGCLLTLPYRYDKKLERMGIKCSIFNPLLPILSPRLNNRDHRKIVVIDGHTGFTGGINLADEYINEIVRSGHWKDAAIMLKGDAVWNMTVMFLSMWDYLRGIDEDFSQYKPALVEQCEKTINYIQPFADSPLDDEPVGQIAYLNLINKAKDYVYITTPYLIIDNEIVTALQGAAKSGIDVRIITPYIPDKWFVHTVTRSYYKVLIESGVRIYEYTPGFIHSKTFIVDDKFGVVGTINMDYRSFYLHFECGVWMYKSPCIRDMFDDFEHTKSLCKEITRDDLAKVRWYQLMGRSVLRAFAPFM